MADGKDYELSAEEEALEAEMQAPAEDDLEPGEHEQRRNEADAKAEAAEAPEAEASEGEEPEDEKPDAEPQEKDADKGLVPLAALDSERHKRKGVEAELAELRQQFGEFVQAQKQAQPQAQPGQQPPQGQQAPQGQPEDMPDPVVEPDKFKSWLAEKTQAASQPYQQLQKAYSQAQQYQQGMHQLKSYAAQHEDAFRQQHPDKDYDGALNFMRERVQKQYEMLGYAPEQVRQMLPQEEAKVVAIAVQRGINPAAYIYNMARQSGFTEQQAREAAEASDEGEKVTRLADVARQTKSAGTAGGQPREEEYTMERLVSMSEAEIAKVPDDVIRRVMGG